MTPVTMHDLMRQMHINLKRSLQNCYAPDGEPDMRNPQVSAPGAPGVDEGWLAQLSGDAKIGSRSRPRRRQDRLPQSSPGRPNPPQLPEGVAPGRPSGHPFPER